MRTTVYSKSRDIEQPTISMKGLKLDVRQSMNGITLLKKIPDNAIPLVFFDPQYRQILDRQSYGNEGERQKQRALLPQMDEQTIKTFLA